MTRPPRSRPSGQSPILGVQVEQVRMPAKEEPTAAGRSVRTADEPAAVPEQTREVSAAATPTQAAPEPDATPAPAADPVPAAPQPSESSAAGPRSRSRRRSEPRNPADYLVGQKATTSLQLYLELKARAETAVLRTAGEEGGVRSLTALINEALAREVMRLEDQFNNGEPFEPNRGAFRMGRPFGS